MLQRSQFQKLFAELTHLHLARSLLTQLQPFKFLGQRHGSDQILKKKQPNHFSQQALTYLQCTKTPQQPASQPMQ